MLPLGRSSLLLAVLAAACLAGTTAEPAGGFAIDKSRTFLGGIWTHGTGTAGIHEQITRDAILRGMPSASANLIAQIQAGVENVDVTHHFDAEYHFDSASVATYPERFEKGFATVARHFKAAQGYARGNPEFFRPTYGSFAAIAAALPPALRELADHPDCGDCASLALKLLATALEAQEDGFGPLTINPNPDPHKPTNPKSVFAFNASLACGLCGTLYPVNKVYRTLVGNVEEIAAVAHKEAARLGPTDPVRKKILRIYQATRAYRGYQELGHAFHATQDFFAHTNYVELMAGVEVETPIPAGTQLAVPQTFRGFSMAGLREIMGAERFAKLESGASPAVWLGDGDFCLGDNLYNPGTVITFRVPVNVLGYFKVDVTLDVPVGLLGKNPLPPKGLNYCHYHTKGAPGLNKDEPGTKEPSHVNHAFARQAATDMTAVIWKSFLKTVGAPAVPPPARTASLTGDWNVDFSFSTAPDAYQRFPGTWTWRQNGTSACVAYSGSGGGKGQGTITKLPDGRLQLSGSSTDKDFGTSTFTLILAKDGSSFSGDWKRDNLSGKWRGSRAGPPSRPC